MIDLCFFNSLLNDDDLNAENRTNKSNTDTAQKPKVPVSVPVILQKVKRIAQLFNQSPKTANALRVELKSRNKENRSLIQEVSTRWNSAFAMLERYYELTDAITIVLAKVGKANFLLTEEEQEVIPDLIAVLEPFMEITKVMSQESVPTISLIVPYVSSLLETIEEMMEKKLETEAGKSFAMCLNSQTKRRLLHYETSTCARLATVLDPRFKSVGFNSIENYDATVKLIREKLKELVKEPSESISSTAAENKSNNFTPNPKGILNKLFSKTRTTETESAKSKRSSSSTTTINSSAVAIVKFNEYLNQPLLPFKVKDEEETNIIQYWNENEFKQLAQLAKEVLVIPGSSVSSERDCSTAEYTINKRRARLRPENVKKIIYLNRNLKFIE